MFIFVGGKITYITFLADHVNNRMYSLTELVYIWNIFKILF